MKTLKKALVMAKNAIVNLVSGLIVGGALAVMLYLLVMGLKVQ